MCSNVRARSVVESCIYEPRMGDLFFYDWVIHMIAGLTLTSHLAHRAALQAGQHTLYY